MQEERKQLQASQPVQSAHIIFCAGCFTKRAPGPISVRQMYRPTPEEIQATAANVGDGAQAAVNLALTRQSPVVFVSTYQHDPKDNLNHSLKILFANTVRKAIHKEVQTCSTVAEERAFFKKVVQQYMKKFPEIKHFFCYVPEKTIGSGIEGVALGAVIDQAAKVVCINQTGTGQTQSFTFMQQAVQDPVKMFDEAQESKDTERKVPASSNIEMNRLIPDLGRAAVADIQLDQTPSGSPMAGQPPLNLSLSHSHERHDSETESEIDLGGDPEPIPADQNAELVLSLPSDDPVPKKRFGCC